MTGWQPRALADRRAADRGDRTMRPLAEHLAAYAAYHRDARNRLTHFFGVPAIIFAILVILALVRGTVDGIEISLAMIFVPAMVVYYLLLDRMIGLALAVLVAPLLALAEIVAGQPLSISIGVFLIFFVGG